MRVCVLTGQAVKRYLQLKHMLSLARIVGGLGRFWGKGNRGGMGRCGENSGRWKPETMQECWERAGVWWKNTERWGVDRGAGGAERGEPGGHRKAGCISSAECRCGNLTSEKHFGTILYFSEIIIMG